MSRVEQAMARQNASGGTKAFYQPNYVPQYSARQGRAHHREAMMQLNSRAVQQRRNMQSAQNYVQAQQAQAPAASVQLDGAERLQQVNTRCERYGDGCFNATCFGNGEAYVEPPQSCSNPCAGGSQGGRGARASHLDRQYGKLPALARPESIPRQNITRHDKRDFNQAQTRVYRDRVADTLRRQHPLAGGDVQKPGMTINAVQAEKEAYSEQHKDGNTEAYAHVEAMQRSIRGYDDTSKKTLDALKVQNSRERARFGGVATCCSF